MKRIINAPSLPNGIMVDNPSQTTVIIVDNDGKCVYGNKCCYKQKALKYHNFSCNPEEILFQVLYVVVYA